MKSRTVLFFFLLLSISGFAQTGIPVPEMSHCDNQISSFLTQFDIPGATVAISKDGKLVYMRAFGNADVAGQETTQPYHMFRIASVSKPITAIAMMKMIEDNELSLSDTVFGPNGIFANNTYFNNANVTDDRIYDITVQHLLEHSGGWDRNISCIPNPPSPYPWNFNSCDPIVFPLHVTEVLGESNPVSKQALVRFLMEKGVNFDPGTQYQYSNIGYLTLGLIIEELTGMSYEAYVKSKVLDPIGSFDMYNAKNLLEDKREREGEYVGNGFTNLDIFGNGTMVPWEYGGMSVAAMDAHGGWIASARDLTRLLVAVDGFSTKPDILSTSSIQTMTTASAVNSNYSFGWTVNSADNWWHTGAIDGTASLWARTSGGYTWAIILNKRVIDGNSTAFWTGLDGLPWSCITQTSSFPSHDLFDFPSENASDFIFKPEGDFSTTVSWTNGNGDGRILIVREDSAVSDFPLDGTDYSADADFGMGDDLGGGQYVAYVGSGNSISITGLDSAKTYHFRLFEYNKNTTTGDHTLYQLAHSAIDSATTQTSTSIADLEEMGIRFFPNPANDWLTIELPSMNHANQIDILNMQGQIVKRLPIRDLQTRISIADLPAQIYGLSFFHDGVFVGSGRLMKK